MELDIPISTIPLVPRPGEVAIMSLLYYMISLNYQKLESGTNEARWFELLIAMRFNASEYTFSLSQSLRISWLLGTLERKLALLKQKLIQMAAFEHHITSSELQQVDFLLASMTSELAVIFRTLRNGSEKSSSPTEE
jgi:hypothetical protein